MPTIVEVSPSAVRVLSGGSGCRPDDAMMSAALDGIDDTVALFDDRPVAVVDVWRVVMASILRGRRDPVVVVHPSWWSWARVQRVVDAAAATGRRVNAQSRSELISRDHPVIEIAGEFVAVCHGPAVWVRCRDDLAAVEEITAELPGNDEVLLDVATGMPGSASTAAAIREILARRGLAARDVCLAERAAAALAPPRWRPAIRAALTVSAVLMVLTGLIVVAWRTPGRAPVPAQPVAAADSTSLVEGRIAVAIPPHWLVQRITAGPGSRRVQVSSPADADLALHITQSYAPETTLAEAAEVLGRRCGRPAGGDLPGGPGRTGDPLVGGAGSVDADQHRVSERTGPRGQRQGGVRPGRAFGTRGGNRIAGLSVEPVVTLNRPPCGFGRRRAAADRTAGDQGRFDLGGSSQVVFGLDMRYVAGNRDVSRGLGSVLVAE